MWLNRPLDPLSVPAWSITAIATLLLGCGTHRIQQRVSLGYTDHKLFAMMHYNAPALDPGPSAGLREFGGTLVGRACGADVNLSVEYHGRSLRLHGFVKNLDIGKVEVTNMADKPSLLEVSDREKGGNRVRTIEGNIGSEDLPEYGGAVIGDPATDARNASQAARLALTPRHHTVELQISQDKIVGRIGFREFDLQAQADTYFGTMLFSGHKLPFRLRGRGSLWSMPAADQAVILPFVLTCIEDDRRLVQDVDVGYER
jgi:acylphosphatase